MVSGVVGTQDQAALALSPQPVLQPPCSDPRLEEEMRKEGCLALSCLACFSCNPSP